MEAKAGRSAYACRIDIRVKTKLDLQKEAYGASLTTLFSVSRQMSAIVQSTAVEKGLPYRIVPEVTVMLGDGRSPRSTSAVFYPGQLLFGEADPEAVGTMKKGIKRRLTQGTGESSSRRSREATPAAAGRSRRQAETGDGPDCHQAVLMEG